MRSIQTKKNIFSGNKNKLFISLYSYTKHSYLLIVFYLFFRSDSFFSYLFRKKKNSVFRIFRKLLIFVHLFYWNFFFAESHGDIFFDFLRFSSFIREKIGKISVIIIYIFFHLHRGLFLDNFYNKTFCVFIKFCNFSYFFVLSA